MSENKLTAPERSDLRRLEKVVEDGMQTFLEVGQALKEIRDAKLYREKWTTFDGYVEDRWEFQKRHAYRLIEAFETKQVVDEKCPTGHKITNERQLRELAKVPESAIQTVLDKVVEQSQETGKPITAAAIKEAAEEIADSVPEQPVRESKQDIGERVMLERSRAKKTVEALMRTVDDLQKIRKSGSHAGIIEKCRELISLIERW